MKPLMAPLACGALAAALLYGLLWAAERKVASPDDPWLDGWLGDGMKAEFRSVSTEPQNHFMIGDAREQFETEPAGTVLRSYLVQNISVQLVQFPKPDLMRSLPEGRALEFRYRPKSNQVHYCRSGRWMLIVASSEKTLGPIIPIAKTTKDRAQQMFDSFEQTAALHP